MFQRHAQTKPFIMSKQFYPKVYTAIFYDENLLNASLHNGSSVRRKPWEVELLRMDANKLTNAVSNIVGKPVRFKHNFSKENVVGQVIDASLSKDHDNIRAIAKFQLYQDDSGTALRNEWDKKRATGNMPMAEVSLSSLGNSGLVDHLAICDAGWRPGTVIINASRDDSDGLYYLSRELHMYSYLTFCFI